MIQRRQVEEEDRLYMHGMQIGVNQYRALAEAGIETKSPYCMQILVFKTIRKTLALTG